jgi:hypothetical protein
MRIDVLLPSDHLASSCTTRDDAVVMSNLTIDDRTVASWIRLNP